MPKKIIAVTGADGQLGKELRERSDAYPGADFIFLSKAALPIDEQEKILHFFQASKPDYCINCAAYTAVDKAESESERAFLINGDSVGKLAQVCAAHHSKLIHVSTDYVFDGTSAQPINEEDHTSPIN